MPLGSPLEGPWGVRTAHVVRALEPVSRVPWSGPGA
jgi:hypothetical protein